MSRPPSNKGLSGLAAYGTPPATAGSRALTPTAMPGGSSKPGSRQGTAAARTPLGTASSSSSRRGTAAAQEESRMSILAGKLIQRFRNSFGAAAADNQGQEIIAQEVLKVLRVGVSLKEEDIQTIANRIRARLVGGTPVSNTMSSNKKAIHQGDEWARIYEFNIAEGKQLDLAVAQEEKAMQMRIRETLNRQKEEQAEKKREEEREAARYAEQEKASLQEWQQQEEARHARELQIINKLKAEREEQLLDKQTRRQQAFANLRAEEDDMAARMAYEAKMELQKEEAQRLEGKRSLKAYLLSNESNKVLKQQAKERAWAEDEYYKKAWEAVLDKQEKERTDRLNRNMARQYKTAQYAASGKLPEYKRWIDPAIIEKHWKDHEAALDRDAAARKAKLENMKQEMRTRLSAQIVERNDVKAKERMEDDALGRVVLARAEAEEAAEQAKAAQRQARKVQLNEEIQLQMRSNVEKRRYQPIVGVERSLNKQLLDKVHNWQEQGTVDVGKSLELPRHLRTTVKI